MMEQSTLGTWIDGYLPSQRELEDLAHTYPQVQVPDRTPEVRGTTSWHRNGQLDLAGSIGAAIRDDFDRNRLPTGVQPVPCCMWLLQIDREPVDPRMTPAYEEYLADPHRGDYYHLVSIRDDCPVGEECLAKLLQDMHFRDRIREQYQDWERFRGNTQELLSHYVDIMAAPFLEVQRLLATGSSLVASAGP